MIFENIQETKKCSLHGLAIQCKYIVVLVWLRKVYFQWFINSSRNH